MEKHQTVAIGIFISVALLSLVRSGSEAALSQILILACFLLPILFYRFIAYLSGFGFPEFLAWDYGSENHPGPYALFFWIVFLIACAFILFQWKLF